MADAQLPDLIGYVEIGGQRYPVKIEQGFRGYLQNTDRTTRANVTNIGSVVSGQSQINTQLSDRINAVNSAAVERDQAITGTTDGSGTFDSVPWFGDTNGATWVPVGTCRVTPSGPGFYDVLVSFNQDGSNTNPAPTSLPTTFNGNYRLVEEQSGGGAPITLATGTFTVTSYPEQNVEGGTLPPYSETYFDPTTPASPYASTYTVMTDIRLELQRASGTNDAINLAGAMSTQWSP